MHTWRRQYFQDFWPPPPCHCNTHTTYRYYGKVLANFLPPCEDFMCESPLRGLPLCTSEVFLDFWPPPTLARKSNQPPLVIFSTTTAFGPTPSPEVRMYLRKPPFYYVCFFVNPHPSLWKSFMDGSFQTIFLSCSSKNEPFLDPSPSHCGCRLNDALHKCNTAYYANNF